MPRIPLPAPADMSPEQKRVHDAVVAGPRGQVIGPLRAVIHSPDLAERWSRLGEFLRYGTCLPPRLNELAIIVTGRRWSSQVEWWVHARVAAEAGLPADVIEAIRTGEPPVFTDADDAAIYEYTRQMQLNGQVDEAAYHAVERRWGARGVVELTGVIGYYTMVSMTLNAHEIPLPDGVAPPVAPPAEGLFPLPPARSHADAAE
ncbi:carboxymuconolactone decarboxylase family protein [Roseomonas marmotae]|uniref:Carboxymuconolactone decarboxylase family protein n=1 Tax=Roseomonas marmotae TaxID=2768161 RepID=A0ABS3KKJ1_9PROT|nr:carboxymuconolactone decarboxylase family protein [Roseomonas marmotae]MBO1076851.1 carboxymuconolactone decarboxylase family protein [Roseomonas marmotae]QTI81188.1 carboxymuconolactone decarboxylase family protein [Roseomonas marmotae]